jgi:TonB family protein
LTHRNGFRESAEMIWRISSVVFLGLFVAIGEEVQAAAKNAETHQRENQASEPKALAIYTPRPEYPFQARARRLTGTGVAVLKLDQRTGLVTDSYMATSTGHKILDHATLTAFRRWRFKPGIPFHGVRIPISFSLTGFRTSTYTQLRVESRSTDEALAAFLGRGTVLRGPMPRYPSWLSWQTKRGKGVYELHVGKDGKVENVKILTSTGDSRFDRIAVKTLRKWRLRRGPMVIELPLSFKLTPTSYAVDIR